MLRCVLAIVLVGHMCATVVQGQEPAVLRATTGDSDDSTGTVLRALDWIREQQLADGSWAFGRGEPSNSCHIGATALCIVSYRSAGQNHRAGKFKNVVERGRAYLASECRWTDEGAVDLCGEAGDMRTHAWAILAFVQLGDHPTSRDLECLHLAQHAVDFAADQQDDAGGWRRSPTAEPSMDATGWMLIALMAAHRAGLKVDQAVVNRANRFLDSVQSDDGAEYGQSLPGNQPLATALGLLGRAYSAPLDNPHYLRGIKQLSERDIDPRDAEYNYVVTLLMCQRGGNFAKDWYKKIREYVVKTQTTKGDNRGSWQDKEPAAFETDGSQTCFRGRLWATVWSELAVATYYRHLNLTDDKGPATLAD